MVLGPVSGEVRVGGHEPGRLAELIARRRSPFAASEDRNTGLAAYANGTS
jgi:hypothetical protein